MCSHNTSSSASFSSYSTSFSSSSSVASFAAAPSFDADGKPRAPAVDVMQSLLVAQADPALKCKKGMSPFDWAQKANNEVALEVLREFGQHAA